MPEPYKIGLVPLEIMQRGLDHLARLLVRTDDMHGMPHGLHPLLENKDLVFLGKLAAQHKNLLATHVCSSCFVVIATGTVADRSSFSTACRGNRTDQRSRLSSEAH